MAKDTNLGQRLQMFREKNKITQQEMAEACGLTKNHISALERGCNKCSAQALISYAQKLNMSIDELTGLPTKAADGRTAAQVCATEEKYAILPELQEALLDMSDAQQRQILDIIRILRRLAD